MLATICSTPALISRRDSRPSWFVSSSRNVLYSSLGITGHLAPTLIAANTTFHLCRNNRLSLRCTPTRKRGQHCLLRGPALPAQGPSTAHGPSTAQGQTPALLRGPALLRVRPLSGGQDCFRANTTFCKLSLPVPCGQLSQQCMDFRWHLQPRRLCCRLPFTFLSPK